MDKTAIEAIQALAHAEHVNIAINKNTDYMTVALPNGYHLQDMEQFCAAPYRFRGHYTTHLIAEFCAYLNANATVNTGIFVDTNNSAAHAIIDMGHSENPKWGTHKATITLKKTPEFAALTAIKDQQLDQLALIDFIEDWHDCIVFVDGTDEAKTMQLPTAIAAIRKLTISQNSESTKDAGDFAANLSSTDLIEVKAQGNTPPKGFIFRCTPYEGLSETRFECRLRAITNGKEVKLKYRIMALDRIIDDIGVEFKEHLRANITAQGAQFYCGEMAYQKNGV